MITREEAKEMFRNDVDSFGKPKKIMSKIDAIYDSIDMGGHIKLKFYRDTVLSIQRILNSDEPEYMKNARIEALVLGKRNNYE